MSESESIQVAVDNETENYTVYESADEDTIVGMYISNGVAEQVGDFAEVRVATDARKHSETATLRKETASYGVYELGQVITGMYVSHDLLGSDGEDESAPDKIGIAVAPSTEDAFEEASGPSEEVENSLVVDADGDSDESESESAESESEPDESESDSTEGEELIDVSDEELGLEQ